MPTHHARCFERFRAVFHHVNLPSLRLGSIASTSSQAKPCSIILEWNESSEPLCAHNPVLTHASSVCNNATLISSPSPSPSSGSPIAHRHCHGAGIWYPAPFFQCIAVNDLVPPHPGLCSIASRPLERHSAPSLIVAPQ